MRRRSARLTAAIIAGLLDDREPGRSEIVHDLQAIWRHEKTGLLQSDRAVVEASMLVADLIASFGGSWPFIFIFLGMIVIWIVVNTILLQHVIGRRPFDPYPYIALNLVLSGLAGIQAPIIMMSQNSGW